MESIKISKMGLTGSTKILTELRHRPFTGCQNKHADTQKQKNGNKTLCLYI